MKKLIIAIALAATAASVSAHGYGGHGYGHRGWGWVAPAVIGGAIGYGFGRYYYTPPPPAYVPPPQPVQPYVEQQLYPVQVWTPSCNCYIIQYRPYPN